jgi:hypothetical protein
MLAKFAKHFVTGQFGEHKIEDNQTRLTFERETQSFLPMSGSDHVVPCMLQRSLIRYAKEPAVLNDQYIHARVFPSIEKHRQMARKLE